MRWSFDDVEVDTDRVEVRRRGEVVAVEPQVFGVLVHLLAHRDRLVPKEELLDHVWGDRFVSESALTSRIKAARRAIGDDGREQRLIRTHHGRGYRFVGAVSDDVAGAAVASSSPPAPVVPSSPVPDGGVVLPVQFARSGDLNIAYQVTGDGPVDIVLVPGFVSHLEIDWTEPNHAHFLRRLGGMGRLIRFDKRGTGLSDRPYEVAHLDARMDDVRAVMDAVGSERAVVFGYSEGGPMAILFAATHAERCAALVLYGSYAKRIRTPDYPWAPSKEDRERYAAQIEREWGWESDLRTMCPSADESMARWWGRRCRAAASPGAARRLVEMNSLVDVRHVLPSVRVPALVLHRSHDRDSSVEEGRYLAEHLPDARFVQLAGVDHFVAVDPDQILEPVEHFLADLEPADPGEWTLATVVRVESNEGARLAPAFRSAVDRFRGWAVTGEDLVATFDGPTRAVRCAAEVAHVSLAHEATATIGVHVGEVQRGRRQLSGPAVEFARLSAACGRAGEVVVTRTVLDLVPGSGLTFAARGSVTLPGGACHDVFAMVAPLTA